MSSTSFFKKQNVRLDPSLSQTGYETFLVTVCSSIYGPNLEWLFVISYTLKVDMAV